MALGFHQAYCKPCQKSRAWRIRRISCRRGTMPSWRYCRTSSRSACTSSGFTSSSCSLLGPRSSAVAATTPRLLSSPQSGKLGGEDAGAAPADAFPSAGAIAPGVPPHVSAVWYGSIHPLRHSLVKIRGGVPVRFRFTPRLDLVPGTLSQARQGLRLRRFGKLHGRKTGRAEQRVHQRAVLRTHPRHFTFEQADVTPLK